MNEKKVDFVMYLESLRNLSIEIDAIALELASCGPDRYWRCELLDQIHIDHPLIVLDSSGSACYLFHEKGEPPYGFNVIVKTVGDSTFFSLFLQSGFMPDCRI